MRSSFWTEPCGCYKERGMSNSGEIVVMSACVFHRHLYSCDDCGALVLPENVAKHKEWHATWES